MSTSRDCFQPEFYISTLDKWATLTKTSGLAETPLVNFVPAHDVKLVPGLYNGTLGHSDISLKGIGKKLEKIVTRLIARLRKNKQKEKVNTCKHSGISFKGNGKKLEKIVAWLKAKSEKNKQKERVNTLNQLQRGVQEKMEHETPSFYTTDVKRAKAKFMPLHKPFQVSESKENLTEKLDSCRKVCGMQEDSCSGCGNVSKEAQSKDSYTLYTTAEVKEIKTEPQSIYKPLKTLQPNGTRDVSSSMNTANASVSDVDSVARLECFRALKLTLLENFRTLKLSKPYWRFLGS